MSGMKTATTTAPDTVTIREAAEMAGMGYHWAWARAAVDVFDVVDREARPILLTRASVERAVKKLKAEQREAAAVKEAARLRREHRATNHAGSLKLAEAKILWRPKDRGERPEILVRRLAYEDSSDWSDLLPCSSGAVDADYRDLKGVEAGHYLMSEFLGIVVGDGVPLNAAFREFSKIEEFLNALPEDMAAKVRRGG